MRSNTDGVIVDRRRSKLHRPSDFFAGRPQFARKDPNNHRGPNYGRKIANPPQPIHEKNPVNSLWVNKIGDRVVGMARLVQDGPRSAEIVLFRIDPEWSHTKVPLNLIRSIESFCKKHGQLNVIMQPHTAPPWIRTMMNQHGFQFSKEKL